MKNWILLLVLLAAFCAPIKAQLPQITLKSIDGKSVRLDTISNNEKPIIVSFFATWCKPCIKEHDALNDIYSDWHDETGVKIYAVSIDDSRSTARVKPFVEGKGWEFDILLDVNGDLKRAMNVSNPPHTFLLDGSGKIVYQHSGYVDGSENELYHEIKKVAK